MPTWYQRPGRRERAAYLTSSGIGASAARSFTKSLKSSVL
jgi:hypothetical protein